MKSITVIKLILVQIIFFYSCTSTTKKPIFKNTISVFSGENLELEFDSIRVIPLQTTKDNLLGNNLKVVQQFCTDIYIGDLSTQKKVFRFNKKGEFINDIGIVGKGPEEYIRFADFIIDTDTIEILAGTGVISRIVRYNKKGDFISDSRIKLATLSFGKIDSNYLFSTSYRRSSDRLHFTNHKGELIDSFLPNETNFNIPITELKFTKSDGSILFRESFDNAVYKFDNKQLRCEYVLDFGEYAIAPELFKKELKEVFGELNRDGFANIKQYFETLNYSVFEIVIQKVDSPCIVKNIIFNKKTKQVKSYTFSEEDQTCLSNLVGVTNLDELIFMQYPHDVIDKLDQFRKLPVVNKEALLNIQIMDNPVLFYCKIKS